MDRSDYLKELKEKADRITAELADDLHIRGLKELADLEDRMEAYLRTRDWGGLEREFGEVCKTRAGEEQSARILGIDLSGYESVLKGGLLQASSAAKEARAKAVLFEFDMDHRWDGSFSVSRDYVPQVESDPDWGEDWGCDPVLTIDGPSLPEFAHIYSENGYCENGPAVGSTALLIARTVAAFGRCAGQLDLGDLAVCIEYHDRGAAIRIRERP